MDTDSILKYPLARRYYADFHTIRKHHIEPDAQKVIGRLNQFGYKAYIVGGCVRDLLLNRQPKDYDVVTNATPAEVRKVFVNSRLIGKRFRIVHVIFKGNKIIEVSTARSLPSTRKHAKNEDDLLLKRDNEFGSFKEDAARRDFTINSLFFDIRNDSIIDYTGGFEDLKEGVIRIIGQEHISLPEDPVRMLRAAKFAGTLGFKLHDKLTAGIKNHRKLIKKASGARLHEEFNKIFRTGKTFDVFAMLVELGLFEAMFPVIARKNSEIDPNWSESFGDTFLGKRLKISDNMINEHEDINVNIYLAILASSVVENFFRSNPLDRAIEKELKNALAPVELELGLSRKETEKLVQIYSAQRNFFVQPEEGKPWINNFKNKIYFLEAFIFYKIYVRSIGDDQGVQRALFWEIGLRKKLPYAIRKIFPRRLPDKSEAASHTHSNHYRGNRYAGENKRNRNNNGRNIKDSVSE